MNWEIEYRQREEVICVRTAGTLTDVNENQSRISAALAEAAKHGATKFLMDDRNMILKLGIGNIYHLPESYEKIEDSRKFKVAIVLPAASEYTEDFKFYETRAINMGYEHRLFTNPDAALAWLTD